MEVYRSQIFIRETIIIYLFIGIVYLSSFQSGDEIRPPVAPLLFTYDSYI